MGRILAGLAVGAAVIAVAGVAVASIPDGGGVVHGCYRTGNVLRVVESDDDCLPAESAVHLQAAGALTGVQTVQQAISFPDGSEGEVEATCPGGTAVTGGGYIAGDHGWEVARSYPNTAGTGWRVYATNRSGVQSALTVYARCAGPTG